MEELTGNNNNNNNNNKKRVRDNNSEEASAEVKRLRENLLDELDDDDIETETEFSWDLDSFMKSFRDEITASPPVPEVVDLTSESGESRPDLGYLLEASDFELGLPPTTVSSPVAELRFALDRVESDPSELGCGFWGEPGYDSFGFEPEDNDEYVALGGLFDLSDLGYGPGDSTWRPETLPAAQ